MDDPALTEACEEINLLSQEDKDIFFKQMIENLDRESILALERALDVVI